MSAAAIFDRHHRTLADVTRQDGIRALCYDRQAALVERLIAPGSVVLDVGCGPSLAYRSRHAYVIGLDPSPESLGVNTDVDDRMVGSAEAIHLETASVDTAVAFYSVHHMTGRTRRETALIRRRALFEMRRVLKPGGDLLVFEMSPKPWFAPIWSALWPLARRVLGERFDVDFWQGDAFGLALPHENLREQAFDAPAWTWFPPVFRLPWLAVPRWAFPFTPMLYRWKRSP